MTTATAVKERPILFSAPMVLAVLAGKKTVTRRVAKEIPKGVRQVCCGSDGLWRFSFSRRHQPWEFDSGGISCPYGDTGDLLWGRETWRPEERASDMVDGIRYRADNTFRPIENTQRAANLWLDAHGGIDAKNPERWRPSIFMPRWASRLAFVVEGSRLERLKDIDDSDAEAEGFAWDTEPALYEDGSFSRTLNDVSPAEGFARLWDELNASRGFSWESNPWVWRVEFRVVSDLPTRDRSTS